MYSKMFRERRVSAPIESKCPHPQISQCLFHWAPLYLLFIKDWNVRSTFKFQIWPSPEGYTVHVDDTLGLLVFGRPSSSYTLQLWFGLGGRGYCPTNHPSGCHDFDSILIATNGTNCLHDEARQFIQDFVPPLSWACRHWYWGRQFRLFGSSGTA
jgi:hypothetical protein